MMRDVFTFVFGIIQIILFATYASLVLKKISEGKMYLNEFIACLCVIVIFLSSGILLLTA